MSIDPTALILVCVVPTPADFEIARVLGWYRIPLRRAPKVISVDYLAFYQPGSFREQGKKVSWYARVHGHELCTRAELFHLASDHPRRNEEYFKVQLGPLERLKIPIHAAGWHRITFLYTTGDLLLRASRVRDLIVTGDERKLLLQSLREKADSTERYLPEDPSEVLSREVLKGLRTFLETQSGIEGSDEESDSSGSGSSPESLNAPGRSDSPPVL